MSAKTEYKPGDRVVAMFNGAGTVVGKVPDSAFPSAQLSAPYYRIVFDRNTAQVANAVSFKLLTPIPQTADPFAPGFVHTLRLNVENVPDTDAFIDKVADRVAAKVTAAQNKESQTIFCYMQPMWSDPIPSRYVTATDKQSIKRALSAGKIVNAPRNSGKTTAILELLRENPGKYVAVFSTPKQEADARMRFSTLFNQFPPFNDTSCASHVKYVDESRLVIYDEIDASFLGQPLPFAAVFSVKS